MRFKICLLAALAIAIAAAPAAAADMTAKAQARSNLLAFPYNGDGMYWGVAVKGGVEQDSASGSFLGTSLVSGSVNALGGGVGGTVGYMHGMQSKAIAFEGSLYYQNVTGAGAATSSSGVAVPVSFATRWSSDQVVKVFGFNPLTLIGNLGYQFPTLPPPPSVPGITVLPNGHAYWMVGVEEWGISGQFFTANSGVSVGVAALVGAGIMNQIIDSAGKLTGAVLDVGAQVVFADKGVALNGLFGPGTPVIGGLTSGRKYEVFAKIEL